ncbi:YggS family pyridoxal phosphate-dependent enzyme [Parasphingorhabdus halotolerans]|uniref:Pyridoxal phosphate homeostasis protein n=1 Tax=Parasphingorhabdus halotolerans TaxID=2725558 RepID=A0A6H2DPQ1_9SPHN|nr:YggS family pyridoxal phosphate-dependent enzyme [Parasphingorhabdus halotolerans]QJB69646.1 YggS family pyridoxal phosphate-dependent enzyme [Parasphingorhabdus halotolerans]
MTSQLETTMHKIWENAKRAGRKPDDIALIAISKTRSVEEIKPLLESGHRLFGENRVQEAVEKWTELREAYPDVKVHLVGQLQSNKAEDAVALFDAIHSLDRMSLVKALAKAMHKLERKVPCFIQVNIGEEPQKGGCDIGALPDLVAAAEDAGIAVEGLMCIPPSGVNAAPYFALLALLAREHGLDNLSMGMSGDFETAIMAGATHIRVGTALFGQR